MEAHLTHPVSINKVVFYVLRNTEGAWSCMPRYLSLYSNPKELDRHQPYNEVLFADRALRLLLKCKLYSWMASRYVVVQFRNV